MTHKPCSTCKWCEGDVLSTSGKCTAVRDPVTGTPLPVAVARMDTWNGYNLTCGFAGAKWEAK